MRRSSCRRGAALLLGRMDVFVVVLGRMDVFVNLWLNRPMFLHERLQEAGRLLHIIVRILWGSALLHTVAAPPHSVLSVVRGV